MPLGIPHSIFLGRVVTPGAPQWLSEDMDKALVYERDRKSRCSSCGTERSDWVDDDGYPLMPPIYEPDSEVCYGCSEIERLRKHITDNDPDARGVYIRLVPLGSADTVPTKEPTEP